MNPTGEKPGGSSYYSVLGIARNASSSEIRSAYWKLALRWHPDRWARDPSFSPEATRRFQGIQEAYSVLSDSGKRALYDTGLYDPFEDEEEGFSEFLQEMLAMMDSKSTEKEDSWEDLQRMFNEMVRGEGLKCEVHQSVKREPSDGSNGARDWASERGNAKRSRTSFT